MVFAEYVMRFTSPWCEAGNEKGRVAFRLNYELGIIGCLSFSTRHEFRRREKKGTPMIPGTYDRGPCTLFAVGLPRYQFEALAR